MGFVWHGRINFPLASPAGRPNACEANAVPTGLRCAPVVSAN